MALPWTTPRLNPARRGLVWWFDKSNPYVAVNVVVDFQPALDYLATLSAEPARVSVNHLIAATIARLLREFPEANGRVLNNRIIRYDTVGIAMPVNLLGHPGAESTGQELGLTVLEEAETLTLREISGQMRRIVSQEREGKAHNPIVKWVLRLAEASPEGALEKALEGLDGALSRPRVAARFFGQVPVTTALSNPGAGFGDVDGALFRAASIELPRRLVSLGTFWGISAVQREVLVVDDAPAVRPALPVLLLFDHRLVDGVKAGEILKRMVEILKDPATTFGEAGQRRPVLAR